MTKLEFGTKLKKQKSLVVTDESQKVYHVQDFWTTFKKCSLLSFSLYSVGAIGSTPLTFKSRRSYPFVAFSEEEFNEVALKFKSSYPQRVNEKAIAFVANQVKSTHFEHEARFMDSPSKNVSLFHPGLTYVCFDLISRINLNGDDIVSELKVGNNLYDKLQNMRCFADLGNFKLLYERECKKLARYHFDDELNHLKDRVSSFDFMFKRVLLSLRHYNKVKIYDNTDEKILMDILIRFGYCCVNQDNSLEVYLSCPLVRTHFDVQYFSYDWSIKKPKSHYSNVTLKEYSMDIIRLLKKENFQIASAVREGPLHEIDFVSEFLITAKGDTKAHIIPGLWFKNPRGAVDLYLNGKQKKGIEFLRNWNLIEEHVDRIEIKYAKLSDYLVIYCDETRLNPDDEKVKQLIDCLEKKNRQRMLLIANFIEDFEKVVFFEIGTVTDKETGEKSSKLV